MSVDYRVGDTRDVIAGIPPGSVSLVACSPPFLALRSYLPADHPDKHTEIGSEPDPATFIDTLLALTADWGRVLAPWGSIAIELGDTYSGSGGGAVDHLPGGMREGQQQFAGSAASMRESNAAHWRQKNQNVDGWPMAKSLALIPQAYALSLAYGRNVLTGAKSPAGRWRVRNQIVWHRPNPAVGALGDKVRPSTSYITVATRSAKRWYDLTAVRTEALDQRTRTTNGTKMIAGNAAEVLTANYQQRVPSHTDGAPPLDCWFDEWDGSHDTWTVTTQPSPLAHYAMWPARLAERIILMMCPAEVCTVCGEPRRRIEHTTNAIGEAAGRRSWRADPTNIGAGHTGDITRSISTAPTAEIETLGLTNCGCGGGTPTTWRKVREAVIDENTGEQAVTAKGKPKWRTGTIVDDPGTPGPNQYQPGVVLDPFAGTGTTLAVADLHQRNAIGIDNDARNPALYPARRAECARNLFGSPIPDPNQLDLFGAAS